MWTIVSLICQAKEKITLINVMLQFISELYIFVVYILTIIKQNGVVFHSYIGEGALIIFLYLKKEILVVIFLKCTIWDTVLLNNSSLLPLYNGNVCPKTGHMIHTHPTMQAALIQHINYKRAAHQSVCICHALFSPLSWNADTTSQPVNKPVYIKHNIFSCKYNCMLELLGLPLVLHILQTFSISLKAMHLLTPIRPKWWS
jgi:hypothetical protein